MICVRLPGAAFDAVSSASRADLRIRWRVVVATFVVSTLIVMSAQAAEPLSKTIRFDRDVRSILSQHCFQCHGPDDKARQAGLRLDDRDAALAQLPSGATAIVPNRAIDSEVVRRITTDAEELAMPPRKNAKKLTDREISVLMQWIDQGADYSKHWAYVRPTRPPIPESVTREADSPEMNSASWSRTAVDRFLFSRLIQEGLRPSLPANRYQLARRISLDLTGLPPTFDDAERLAADPSPDAMERAVDRYLASPAYGERWGAIWLDLARYGDSQGYIHDPPRTIWRWRDWLIGALNADMPYDQFTTEMLAGDLLPNATSAQKIATGFHRNTTNNTEGGSDTEEYRHASVVDRVNTTMQVWQGTTIGCAQCHNHKYDPFSQREYYQLFAIFNSTEDNNSEAPILDVSRVGWDTERQSLAEKLSAAKAALAQITEQVDVTRDEWERSVDRGILPKDIADLIVPGRTKEQTDKIAAYHRQQSSEWIGKQNEVNAIQRELDQIATTTLIMKEGLRRPTHIALRGEYKNKGDEVTAGVPTVLNPLRSEGTLDRLNFSKWLIDSENPLTARVAVNRLWQEIFGIGIVESSEEFGSQGDAPVHPELLDWLACEFIDTGWHAKSLVRQIVLSSAYAQSSEPNEELLTRDPLNRWIGRGARVRLSAETIRDQALSASGLMSGKLFGPPVHPPQPVNGLSAAFGASTDWETSRGEDRFRRALYTRWRRNLPYASMITFDAPERSVCSMRRIRTNTPLQALVTLNDPVFFEAAQALGRRLMLEGGETTASRVAFGIRTVLGRPAQPREIERLVGLMENARAELSKEVRNAESLATKPIGPLPKSLDPVDAAAWTVVGNVLLNLDEFLTKR